jgi:hypothetical protein
MKEFRIRFNYPMIVDCIPGGFTENTDPGIVGLVTSSLAGSMNTARTQEFQAQFAEQPDSVETQLKILAALLDNACERLKKAFQQMDGDPEANCQDLLLQLRAAFAVAGITCGMMSMDHEKTPLIFQLLEEKAGEGLDEKLITSVVENYFSTLKVLDFLKEQGIVDRVLVNLVASLI